MRNFINKKRFKVITTLNLILIVYLYETHQCVFILIGIIDTSLQIMHYELQKRCHLFL